MTVMSGYHLENCLLANVPMETAVPLLLALQSVHLLLLYLLLHYCVLQLCSLKKYLLGSEYVETSLLLPH